MLPCSNCGRLAEDGARFCPMCGERITAVPAPPPAMPPPVPRRRRARTLAIVAGLVVLSIVVGLTLAVVLTSRAGRSSENSNAPSSTAPIPQGSVDATGTTQLTVAVFNCAGCDITAHPADGLTTALTVPVVDGQAHFRVPKPSTVGMSFQITHPSGFGSANGPNVAVLSPEEVPPGVRVGASTLIKARSGSVCWAGTLASQTTIGLVVEPFSDGTRTGNLRAWADPALATLPQDSFKGANGTVEAAASGDCVRAYGTAADELQ